MIAGLGRLRIGEHRATTAHASSLYPFSAQAGPGCGGVVLGLDALSGDRFAYDPFLAYRAGLVTNPNMLVAGQPGTGKSAFVKSLVHRAGAQLGRWSAVTDPKGEYRSLAHLLGMSLISLRPGGPQRLNPLEAAAGETASMRVDRRSALCEALASAVLTRALDAFEDSALTGAVTLLAAEPHPTLRDLVDVLANPPGALAERLGLTSAVLAERVRPLTLALGRLLDRSLRGMFDGRSTVHPDPDGAGVVIDLSAVHRDPAALAVVLVATMSWLQGVLVGAGRPRLNVIDEAWAVLSDEPTVRFLQASWKLSRAYGVANVAVVHRLSDLRAQHDDGSAAAKIAGGLLADTATRVLFRQAPDQLDDARSLLGLTTTETLLIGRLARGRALWRLGDRVAVVQHYLSRREASMFDTDAAMGSA